MGSGSRAALLIAASAHLAVVALGALKVHVPEGWAKRVIGEYGAFSGAENYYTFFAPDVDVDLQVTFEVTDRSGQVIADVLKGPENQEVDLRVGNLKSMFWWEDADLHRLLVAAWAGVMFTRHPGARRVVVRIEACDVPSMDEHRAGDRIAWRVYETDAFSPGAGGAVAEEARR